MHATTRVAARRPPRKPRGGETSGYTVPGRSFSRLSRQTSEKGQFDSTNGNGFAYNDREIGYRADFGAHYGPMCAERRAGYLVAEMTKLPTDEHRRKSTTHPIGHRTAPGTHRAWQTLGIGTEEKFRRLRPRSNLSDVSDDARENSEQFG